MIEITQEMILAGMEELCHTSNCSYSVKVASIYKAMESVRTGHIDNTAIKPPNDAGQTQCIVRWMVETPEGWVGAWNIEAIKSIAGVV